MTGALSYAAAQEHTEDLRRVAKERRRGTRTDRSRRRRPLIPRLRPRHA
ncbi:MAG TPA: hypothetical protein VI122_13505 [Thermoleophilaceae bacterium]